MPDHWVPPAPAWESVWPDTNDPLLTACFAVQGDSSDSIDAWAKTAFAGNNGPLAIERGLFEGAAGQKNFVYVTYFRASSYLLWWTDTANSGWWNDDARLQDRCGYWREVFVMPFDRFETLHSTENPHGIGVSAERMQGPILEHGYPGGMRDRIPLSDSDTLHNIESVKEALDHIMADEGRRIVVSPPKNMCSIRSGQNWSACTEEQKEFYLNEVHPVLLNGMRFLQDNPVETNCYALRFINVKDEDWGATEQSFGLGYATDVYAFENWAKSHPTHVAIFDSFMEMVNRFGADLKLQLWHEVTALPGEGCEFEYINCHPSTGLLSYI